MAFGNTGGGDVIASLPGGGCLKAGRGTLLVNLFLVIGLGKLKSQPIIRFPVSLRRLKPPPPATRGCHPPPEAKPTRTARGAVPTSRQRR